MSTYRIHFDVTIVKCSVTTKTSVVDTLYAATVLNLNIAHLASVINLPNVSTAQVTTLQTLKNAHSGKKKKQILKIKCEQNISFPEARKQYEQFNGAKTYASAVKPGTCNKSTQTDNKSTQTDDSFNEYLQQQTTEKTKDGTQGKSNSSPHPGKSNSSPGPALKAGTLEMIKKDEEKKRKEEKDKLKKQQKEERKQIFLKEQAQKEKELTEKAKQAEKNPYSVFAEKDGEEVMDDESVVFTEPSSSDHLPKGTLSRLPLT